MPDGMGVFAEPEKQDLMAQGMRAKLLSSASTVAKDDENGEPKEKSSLAILLSKLKAN